MKNAQSDKNAVAIGIVLAWVISAVFIGLGYLLNSSYNVFAGFTPQELLSVTLLPPTLSLAAGIGWAAKTRHGNQNIDGSAPPPGTPLDITLRYIRNTSEQLLLFCLMVICLWGAVPHFAAIILPVLGLWFLVARALFWIGYQNSPSRRSVGFAATFHPTLIFLMIAAIALSLK